MKRRRSSKFLPAFSVLMVLSWARYSQTATAMAYKILARPECLVSAFIWKMALLVVTDRDGKYNFYGVKALTHVLKLDTATLPANAEMPLINNRQAGDPGSRFVDMKRGEPHRADLP